MTLIEARDVSVSFHLRREGDLPWTKPRVLQAVRGVSFPGSPPDTRAPKGSPFAPRSRDVINLSPSRPPFQTEHKPTRLRPAKDIA